MKIEITEEMREAVRRWREQRAAGGIAYTSANDLARLVAEAVEGEAKRCTCPPCALCDLGNDHMPCECFEPRCPRCMSGEGEAETCTWAQCGEGGPWDTGCGQTWELLEGDPGENNIRFCHGCGKPVEVACEATPEKARQQ